MTDQKSFLDLRSGYAQELGFNVEAVTLQETGKGLSADVVRKISEIKQEPQWMLDFRLKALDIFMKKPMPTWGADLSKIIFENITYYSSSTKGKAKSWEDLPEGVKNTFDRLGIPEAEKNFLAGVEAQFDSEVVYSKVREDLEKLGVVFCSTDEALKKYPDLVKKYFATVVPPHDNKFAALNSAVWSGGSFVYVPKGVDVPIPLQAYFRINSSNMGQFERTLIIADEGSKVHYVEGCSAPQYSSDSLHSAVVEVIALEGAHVRYTTLQNWWNNVYNLVTKRAFAHRNAFVEWLDANIGCLTGDTKIFLNSGVKNIKDAEPGDVVFSLDENMHLSRHQILGKKYSGKQKVFRLVSENHREITATGNHPFLALTKTGKHLILKWKRLDEITDNDLIALAGDVPDYGKPMKINYSQKTGTKDIKYPETTTDGLMWLLGFYAGDGYVHGSRVYFAVPETDKSWGKIIEIIKKIFNLEKHEIRRSIIRYNSVDLLRFIKHLGFGGTAREKRVPEWVFTLPKSQKLAFINGYIDADGHIKKGHKNISITSVNKPLLEDIKTLAISCGLDARKISKWTRKEKKPLGKEEKEYTHYFLYFGEQPFNKPVHFVRVSSIDYCGEEDTYDIEIEDVHNFVANGFIVHNSKITMKYPSVFMLGEGARADMMSIAFAGEGQQQDAGAKAIHLAKNTKSTIISKSISKGGGKTTYRGLVRVDKGCTGVKSNVRCDALLLDEKSVSETVPYMEIEEKKVSIGHEASVGRVNEEQLFYLMSRGLTEQEATGLIVRGFFECFTKQLPLEYAVEFNRLIELEMEGSVG